MLPEPLGYFPDYVDNFCITVTRGGRIFATGSKSVYEIVAESGSRFRSVEIPVVAPVAPGVPVACLKNGLAVHGDSLYLACFRVRVPFLENYVDLTEVKQNLFSFVLVFPPVETIGQSASWIVRADLPEGPVTFDTTVASMPRCFANGLAIDAQGEHLLRCQ
jgi:hypothetical protein